MPDALETLFALGALFWRFLAAGGWIALLIYGLVVTQDYRKRKRFSDATAHMILEDLQSGLAANMWVISTYLKRKPKSAVARQQAEAALVMATVLREHIAVKMNVSPGPRYLKARRAVLREARKAARTWD